MNVILYLLAIQIFLIFAIISISKKLDLLDYPNHRKSHKKATPYTGGIFISISFLIIVFFSDFQFQELNLILSYSFLASISGLLDDKYNLNPGSKLVLQILPMLFLIDNNVYLNDLGDYEFLGKISLGAFSKIFTILSCLLLINAFNYSDGLDGLLGIISLIIITFYILILFLININFDYLIYISLPLMIFLIFNIGLIKNFKIFLGDSGSLLLGFLFSFISIFFYTSLNIHPSIIIWPLAYIVFEFLSVNLIRMIKNKKIFLAGNDHFHYELIKKFNISNFLSVVVISLLNIFFCFIGIIIYMFELKLFSLALFIIFFITYFIFRIKLHQSNE